MLGRIVHVTIHVGLYYSCPKRPIRIERDLPKETECIRLKNRALACGTREKRHEYVRLEKESNKRSVKRDLQKYYERVLPQKETCKRDMRM